MTRILVIEDNVRNRYLISFILKGDGFEVIEAITGEDGVEMAQKERPDVVLMDIQLPGIDGYEATRRIRALPEGKDVPVIALTSYAMTGDREKALAAGCTGYIEKPLNPDTILDEIRSFMRSG
jgi:two-component system cell cycle response regulator DivK